MTGKKTNASNSISAKRENKGNGAKNGKKRHVEIIRGVTGGGGGAKKKKQKMYEKEITCCMAKDLFHGSNKTKHFKQFATKHNRLKGS